MPIQHEATPKNAEELSKKIKAVPKGNEKQIIDLVKADVCISRSISFVILLIIQSWTERDMQATSKLIKRQER
jgi:hypothetical protein